MMPLVLASASATRARLLSAAGVAFEVVPASVDEERYKIEWARSAREPARLAPALALEKARAVAAMKPERVVLGCDQILLLDGEPVSKCTSRTEARMLLRRLRARTHELVTAATLVGAGRVFWQHSEVGRLAMRDFSDDFLDEYVSAAPDALTQCVGAYELEGFGIQLFERVCGDFFSVLGLPLLPLLAQLRQLGLARP